MEMKLEKINIDQLKEAEYNPRVINPSEMERLKKGLKTHGLVDPLIIDLTDDYTVIGGHQRLAALKELYPDKDISLGLIRLGDIGLVIKDTDLKVKDKNDQKAINLSLNKIQGDWDYDKLDSLLLDLKEEHYDVELTGFDEEYLDEILFDTNSDLDDVFVDKKIDEALNNIYNGLELNDKINDGKIEQKTICFYTSDDELYAKFLDFVGLKSIKKDKKRNVKLETLECLKE